MKSSAARHLRGTEGSREARDRVVIWLRGVAQGAVCCSVTPRSGRLQINRIKGRVSSRSPLAPIWTGATAKSQITSRDSGCP